jgi:hypothetical protein
MTAEGRLLHDDEARPLQVLDDPLGGDLRHVLVGLMHPREVLAAGWRIHEGAHSVPQTQRPA